MTTIDDGKVAERWCACGCGISLVGRAEACRHASDRCRSKMAHAAYRALHPPKERKPKALRIRREPRTEAEWRETLWNPCSSETERLGWTFDPALQAWNAPNDAGPYIPRALA